MGAPGDGPKQKHIDLTAHPATLGALDGAARNNCIACAHRLQGNAPFVIYVDVFMVGSRLGGAFRWLVVHGPWLCATAAALAVAWLDVVKTTLPLTKLILKVLDPLWCPSTRSTSRPLAMLCAGSQVWVTQRANSCWLQAPRMRWVHNHHCIHAAPMWPWSMVYGSLVKQLRVVTSWKALASLRAKAIPETNMWSFCPRRLTTEFYTVLLRMAAPHGMMLCAPGHVPYVPFFP